MKKWVNPVPPGTPAEIKARRNAFLKKHSKEIADRADSDVVGKTKRGVISGLKFVDDSMVDPVIRKFKNLVKKVSKK